MLKLSMVVSEPCMGQDSLRCSLYLSSNVLTDSQMYTLFFVNPVTSIPVYNTTFVLYGIIVLGRYKNVLDGSVAPEVSVHAIHTTYPFEAFAQTFLHMV